MDVTKEDRSYVAAEVNSFLIAWLSSLNCPVVNRPVGNCLAGPDWRPEQWVNLAASIDIPIKNVHREINLRSRKNKNTDIVCGNTKTNTQQAIVMGKKWFGEIDDYLGSIAVCLARAAGTELLLVRFEDHNFVGASTFPPLDKDPVINAVLDYLEGGSS
jgi:hypothetical protein